MTSVTKGGDVEGVGGVLQKLVPFYCVFRHFRPFYMLGYSANETVVVFSIFAQFFECTHRWNAFFTQIF